MTDKNQYFIKRPAPLFSSERVRQETYRRTFEHGDGATVLQDLMNVAGMDRISYSKDSARQTDFNEGKKFMMHHIVNLLNVQLTTTKDLDNGQRDDDTD